MPKAGVQRTAGGGFEATSTDYYHEWERLNRMTEIAGMFTQRRQEKNERKKQRIQYLAQVAVEAAAKGIRPPESLQREVQQLKETDPTAYDMYQLELKAAQEKWSSGKAQRESDKLLAKQGLKAQRAFGAFQADIERLQQQGQPPMMSTEQGPMPGFGPPMQQDPFQQQMDPMQAMQQAAQNIPGADVAAMMQQGIDPSQFGVSTPYGYDPTDVVGPPRNLAVFEAAPGVATPEMMESARLYAETKETPHELATGAETAKSRELREKELEMRGRELGLAELKFKAEPGEDVGKGYRRLPRRAVNAINEALAQAMHPDMPPGQRSAIVKTADNWLEIINGYINKKGFSKSEAVDEGLDFLEKLGVDLGE